MPASVMPEQGGYRQHAEGGTAYGQVAGRNHARRSVPCVVDGRLYPSTNAAAKALGLPQPGLSKAIKRGDAEFQGHALGGTRVVGTAPRPDPAEPHICEAEPQGEALQAEGPEPAIREADSPPETRAEDDRAPAAETNWERYFGSPRKAARMQIAIADEGIQDRLWVTRLGEAVADLHPQGLLDWMEAEADQGGDA